MRSKLIFPVIAKYQTDIDQHAINQLFLMASEAAKSSDVDVGAREVRQDAESAAQRSL